MITLLVLMTNHSKGIHNAFKYGAQEQLFDQYSSKQKHAMMDARRTVLYDKYYREIYCAIETTQENKGNNKIMFHIQREQCDLINHIDLMISFPHACTNKTAGETVHEWIASVTTEFGGDRFDTLYTPFLLPVAALHARHSHTANNKFFIPLALSPIHDTNLVPPSTKYHDLNIIVDLKKPLVDGMSMEIYGKKYYLETMSRFEEYTGFTHQTQFSGTGTINKGVNRIPLHLNHLVRAILFSGMDKSKVRRIRLLLDGEVFYEGDITTLQTSKEIFGYPNIDTSMIVFSYDTFDKYPWSAINFSKIDEPILEIETDEDQCEICIAAVNINMYVMSCGYIGMKFRQYYLAPPSP